MSTENKMTTDPIGLVDNSLLLTPREVAARLKVSVSTVRAWVKDGKLVPAIKLPRTRRFLWLDVEKMLARAAAESAAKAARVTKERELGLYEDQNMTKAAEHCRSEILRLKEIETENTNEKL